MVGLLIVFPLSSESITAGQPVALVTFAAIEIGSSPTVRQEHMHRNYGEVAALEAGEQMAAFAGSPIRDRDIATQYLRLILGVIGNTDVTVVAGGGAKVVDLGEQTMGGYIASLAPEIDRAAAG